ncbi:hypothetical protein VTL71DRAFT_3398 [Oculimacula yallundae]|uniref:Heterokaryon incompatibility domain-containing protein n=1 Tax=Oculimacula yallundae TaxID=86028 RepID=A0ABR4C730_9HELO
MFGPHKPPTGSKPNDDYTLHENYEQLSNCLSCVLCQHIRRELLYVTTPDGQYRWPIPQSFPPGARIIGKVRWSISLSARSSLLRIYVEGDLAIERSNPLRLLTKLDMGNGLEGFVRQKDTSKILRDWIDDCVGNHKKCSKIDHDFRPTRLLDVGDPSNGNIRLVRSELGIKGVKNLENHYATLSYCWGPPGLNATTTLDNIEARSRNIPFRDLPATVQDAVSLTRQLCVRYLWVDALCIIQGDKNDWSKESGVMGQIYRRSLFTIAACIGDDCAGGLFNRREAANLPAHRPFFTQGTGELAHGFILEPKVEHWYSSIERSVISTRGWVMQERILAARTIFCTEDGVFWQCAEKSSSEFTSDASTEWKDGDHLKPSKPKFAALVKDWRVPAKEYRLKSSGKVNTQKISLIRMFIKRSKPRQVEARPWHNLIFEFTRRKLTQNSDRLNAVQGIGREFAISANDIYVENAGVWKSDILGGMAWYREWQHSSDQLSIAPSWSWASTSGHIVSLYERTGHVVNLATVNWSKTSPRQLTEKTISIKELHISGNICRIRIYRKSEDGIFCAHDPNSSTPSPPEPRKSWMGLLTMKEGGPNPESLSGIKSATGFKQTFFWGGTASYVQNNHYEVLFDVSTMDPELGTEFLCMVLVGAGFQAQEARVFPMAVVLVPVDAARKVYRRVGLCFMWAEIPDDRLREVEIILI